MRLHSCSSAIVLACLLACPGKTDSSSDDTSTTETGEPDVCSQGVLAATQIVSIPDAYVVGAVRDAAGNFYVADQGGSRIIKVDAAGVVTDLVTSIFELGEGIAELELVGTDLYFIETNTSSVFVVDLNGLFPVEYNTLTPFAQDAFNDPGGLTHDSAGNLYISSLESSSSLGWISVIDPTGAVTDLNWWTDVEGSWPTLAIDESDNLYMVETNDITQITQAPAGTNLATGLNGPVGLDYAMGCVYFSDDEGVKEIALGGSGPTLIFDTSTLSITGPTRVVVDPLKSIYLWSTDTLWKLM